MTFKAFRKQSKPHAMDKAVTPAGVFPSTPQAITYTGFDKVLKVKQGSDSLVYSYGYDRQRIAMEEHLENTRPTKHYVGNCEFVNETSGNNSSSNCLTYLTGPTGVYAVVETQNGAHTLHYILKDNLGSWTTITDSDGNVEQRSSYDAWGNLIEWKTESGKRKTIHFPLSTFHLNNYDPVMSSFLSVDQFVHGADNSQGFNRYVTTNTFINIKP